MVEVLVLPSPFLGPAAYEPLAVALRESGLSATVGDCDAVPDAARLVAEWSTLARDHRSPVLVAHSNAGLLAPAVSEAVGRAPIVFVDASLPDPGATTRLAPPEFRSFLAGIADADGLLPRWTRWWPRQEMSSVLPGPWFHRLDAELPRVPLAYVDSALAVPTGWEDGPRGYLAFGDTYADELRRARRLGWPTLVLDGGHAHWLVDAEGVADAVGRLVAAFSEER